MFNAHRGSSLFAFLVALVFSSNSQAGDRIEVVRARAGTIGPAPFSANSQAGDGIEGSYRHTANNGRCRAVQAGAYFRFTNEHQQVATVYRELVAVDWPGEDGNPAIGTLEGGGKYLAWSNRTAWTRLTGGSDFEGVWSPSIAPETRCTIRRRGDVLEIENQWHNLSRGLLNVVAKEGWPHGVLVGELRDGEIRWRNGSVWVKQADTESNAAEVEISVPWLTCLNPTESSFLGLGEAADEVYFLIEGKTPAGDHHSRLPSPEGYYALMPNLDGHQDGRAVGWKGVDDKPQPKPILWAGMLAPGEKAQFVVLVGEQDNNTKASIVNKLVEVAKIIFSAEVPDAAPVADAVGGMFSESENDQVIGVFAVHVANEAGKITTSWAPLRGAKLSKGQGMHPKDLPRHRYFIEQQGFELDSCAWYKISVDVWAGSPSVKQ